MPVGGDRQWVDTGKEFAHIGSRWGKVGRSGARRFSRTDGGLSGFLGSYQHQIDEKGRLSLPAPFRRDAEDEPTLVLVQAYPDCLTLYPASAWADVEERLRELLRREPSSRNYVLGITANAVEVSPDRQGRILVPHRLQEAAGLEGATMVVGAIDRIELWHPDRFARTVAVQPDDQERFTHHIFA